MSVENPQVDEIFRGNNGEGPDTAKVLRIGAGDVVHMERWQEGKPRRKCFSLRIADLARPSCGWSRVSSDPMKRINDLEAENRTLRDLLREWSQLRPELTSEMREPDVWRDRLNDLFERTEGAVTPSSPDAAARRRRE